VTQSSSSEPFEKWRYKDIEVFYRKRLDGAGTDLAVPFVDFVRANYPGKNFPSLFEWCAGPGFTGFSLLHENICDRLCLADINRDAIECVAETTRFNNLGAKVSYYVSDNFDDIPANERFDLIVGTPPHFCGLIAKDPQHEISKDDLRPIDPDWQIHRKFYSQVRKHLLPGGLLLISEAEPTLTEVIVGHGEGRDVRHQAPLIDFKYMIERAGLSYVKTVPYAVCRGSLVLFIVISQGPEKENASE
jgi:methylase of polypeptide subunit release factors